MSMDRSSGARDSHTPSSRPPGRSPACGATVAGPPRRWPTTSTRSWASTCSPSAWATTPSWARRTRPRPGRGPPGLDRVGTLKTDHSGRASMLVRDKIYINGAWVPSTGKGTLEVIDSATAEVFATIPEGTAEEVDNAGEAGAAA